MNTHPAPSSSPSDDIDLLALIESSYAFFRKYLLIFIIAISGGILAGYSIWLIKPAVYKSRMIVHSYTLSNEDFIQVIDNYNRLLKRGETGPVSEAFGMPASELGKVKQIKPSQIQRVFTPTNPNGFFIDVFVTDNSVLPALQKGIVDGLENIDFLKRQMAIKKENFRILISEVEKEIKKLDSTKTEVSKSLKGQGTQGSSLIIDISGLNKQIIELNEKLLAFKQEIQFVNAVQVLQGFVPYSKPVGPRLLVWLGLGLISGLVIAYLFSIILSTRTKLKIRQRA